MCKKNIGESEEALIFEFRVKSAVIGVKYWRQEEDCLTLDQIHSNVAIRVDEKPLTQRKGDALVTNKAIKIGVKTADCVPIILVGDRDVAAIHAGWRGLKDGIIQNTLKLMEESPGDILAFLGPSAKACCYQVDLSFKDFFKAITLRNARFYMDTQKEALIQLKRLGVKRFFVWSSCSVCNPSLPSHRRDQTKERLVTFVEKIL